MSLYENELREIHEQACNAVRRANRTITPVDGAFWPVYLQAAFEAANSANNADTQRLDWLDRAASSSFEFEHVNLTFRCPRESLEGTNSLRDLIDYARRSVEEPSHD